MKIRNTILTAVVFASFACLEVYRCMRQNIMEIFNTKNNGENVSIYAYNGSDKEVTIPAYINGKAVTEINDYAFYYAIQ